VRGVLNEERDGGAGEAMIAGGPSDLADEREHAMLGARWLSI
jgi:hypothetical protein